VPARPPYIGVVGASEATSEQYEAALEVGGALASAGAVVVCGGLGGVMEAACRGVAEAGGTSVGLLPGADPTAANEWMTIALPTGLGELRNGLIIRAVDAVIAIGRGYGTLSEIALALRAEVPVFGLATWEVEGVQDCGSPASAVERALEQVQHR
jgi:uncharacterized protein (TIGR00725 family)